MITRIRIGINIVSFTAILLSAIWIVIRVR